MSEFWNRMRCQNSKARWWASCAVGVLTLVVAVAVSPCVADDQAVDSPAVRPGHEPPIESSQQHIAELIEQLGSSQFTTRRAAANELRKIGPEAFDQLHAAADHVDPEIAASARYLLQVAVQWTRSDDSALVRRMFRDYSAESESARTRVVQQLALLGVEESQAALCRIARFDQSSSVSRLAALALIGRTARGEDTLSPDPDIIDRELGSSGRVASQWLHQYQIQLRDPAASVPGWQRLVDEEFERLDSADDDTSTAIVTELLWNQVDLQRRLGNATELVNVADRIVVIHENNGDPDRAIVKILEWLLRRESWEAIDLFSARHDERIQNAKLALYLLAMSENERGKNERAEQFAEQALQLAPRQPRENLNSARILGAVGQSEWAIRECRQVIKSEPVESVQSIGSRLLICDLLKDVERYEEAADALGPLVAAIEGNRDVQRAYINAQSELRPSEFDLPAVETLSSRLHFMQACQFEQQGDFAKQREHLLQAIERDPEDADVLIAMYRLQDADAKWQTDTRQRIKKLSEEFAQAIDENPDHPVAYNQWAWLIANTEGDYQKAVRYSRRSLELLPETAGFLDTLGRCYYAVGDYEKAVKCQRQAVELGPHMQVMQRQLRQFEEALSKKKESATGTS